MAWFLPSPLWQSRTLYLMFKITLKHINNVDPIDHRETYSYRNTGHYTLNNTDFRWLNVDCPECLINQKSVQHRRERESESYYTYFICWCNMLWFLLYNLLCDMQPNVRFRRSADTIPLPAHSHHHSPNSPLTHHHSHVCSANVRFRRPAKDFPSRADIFSSHEIVRY